MKNKLFQYSTISSLIEGNFEGEISFKEVMKNGDFGIGTFDSLDGELIAFDNNFFKLTSDGRVFKVNKKWTTPFVSVTNFKKDFQIEKDLIVDKADLNSFLIKNFIKENKQNIYAIKIKGFFENVTTRTVSKQKKPYKGLLESTKNQERYEIKKTSGNIIGFYTPHFLNNVGVEGLHIHFIDNALEVGGHLFDFQNMMNSTIEISIIKNMNLLIGNKNFRQDDIQKEIHEAEK